MSIIIPAKVGTFILTFINGHFHDFTLYKKGIGSQVAQEIKLLLDSGYQGILEVHTNSKIPQKSRQYHPLDEQEKQTNFELSKARIPIEHVNAKIKVFKMFSTKDRNRRTRFELRMTLVCGILNVQGI